MRKTIQLEFPRNTNPRYALLGAGAQEIERANVPLIIGTQSARTPTVYIYTPNDQNYFVKSPYETLSPTLPTNTVYYQLDYSDYDHLCDEYNIKTKIDSEWSQITVALGIGDMLW